MSKDAFSILENSDIALRELEIMKKGASSVSMKKLYKKGKYLSMEQLQSIYELDGPFFRTKKDARFFGFYWDQFENLVKRNKSIHAHLSLKTLTRLNSKKFDQINYR
ncbi:MAG: hypothetical protein JW700_02110 [Candidatus Aenigmarchaeota archaeon]|nr:hypothetical protein [Candidatus Aenigmarchaeota archaeon]